MPRTHKRAAWDGRVVFCTRPVSYGTLEEMNEYKALLEKHHADLIKKLPAIEDLPMLLAMTGDLEFYFQGDEEPLLEDLRDFWQAFSAVEDRKKRLAQAVEWRKITNSTITDEWIQATNDSQVPFRRPAQLPEKMLEDDERVEAANPESPLVESVPSLEAVS